MKVIVGAAASVPFFHFGSTLMGLICCLYCLILSFVITAAFIITSSCYPRASSCTSYLFPQTPTSISVASLVLSSCKRSCDWYVISMCSNPRWSSLLHALWGYLFCVTARAYRVAVRITVVSCVVSRCKRSCESYVISMCSSSLLEPTALQ